MLVDGKSQFEWDVQKDALNQKQHGVSFAVAQHVLADLRRFIAKDEGHSKADARFYGFGEAQGAILTVRFTFRASVIRIIGAGYWRKGKAIYERENPIHE
ncbi:MAG: BrnT family toxin [Acidiferrobacter sp.]